MSSGQRDGALLSLQARSNAGGVEQIFDEEHDAAAFGSGEWRYGRDYLGAARRSGDGANRLAEQQFPRESATNRRAADFRAVGS